MQFSLATPEESKKNLADVNKVKIHLTTGIVEILDKHQDLLGKVDLNFLEIENNTENKVEKLKFLIQDALVIVANKGLNSNVIDSKDFIPNTGVYIYAKRVLEITSNISIDEFLKKIEQKSTKLDSEKQALTEAKINNKNIEKIVTKILLLEKELEFEKKVVSIIKDLRG